MCHIARGQEVLQSLLHVTALCEGPPETRNNAPGVGYQVGDTIVYECQACGADIQ
jgi:hypothetical protein